MSFPWSPATSLNASPCSSTPSSSDKWISHPPQPSPFVPSLLKWLILNACHSTWHTAGIQSVLALCQSSPSRWRRCPPPSPLPHTSLVLPAHCKEPRSGYFSLLWPHFGHLLLTDLTLLSWPAGCMAGPCGSAWFCLVSLCLCLIPQQISTGAPPRRALQA